MHEDSSTHKKWMRKAIDLSIKNVAQGGGPFGAVIVKDGEIIAEGTNHVTAYNDPTAHAEVCAIRSACSKIGDFKLKDCTIYTSCEPCPMCLSAIYWAGISRIYYGNTKKDAEQINFGDNFIYDEIAKPNSERAIPTKQIMHTEALEAFKAWEDKEDKIEY